MTRASTHSNSLPPTATDTLTGDNPVSPQPGPGQRPIRIQLKRTKGWRMPANTVKVDRTTKWGNPFAVIASSSIEEVIADFRRMATHRDYHDVSELRGKNLACWCKPGAPCHADVLLELANAPADVTFSQCRGGGL